MCLCGDDVIVLLDLILFESDGVKCVGGCYRFDVTVPTSVPTKDRIAWGSNSHLHFPGGRLKLILALQFRLQRIKVRIATGMLSKLKNPPSKHLVFEEPKLDKQELGKLEVGKPRVDKQVHG
nr:hypothetical protein [Tanacetum cinerariifolium]